MNDRQLKIYFEVATRLNMTEAAKNLSMTQPAISQTIKEIEAEYQEQFFDRIGKKLYLTNAGEVLLSYTRRLLNINEECLASIKELKNFKKGQLKIGASTTIGIYILTDIIGEYKRQNKEIDISIIIENTKNISNLILENKIDFAFIEGPISSNEIIKKDFWDDELTLICSINHPFAKIKTVKISDLEKEKIIMREQGSGTREVFEGLLSLNNIKPNNYLELGSSEAIKKAVEAGLGISCISKRAIEKELNHKTLIPLKLQDTVIVRKLKLIYHKDKDLSNLSKDFIKFCKNKL